VVEKKRLTFRQRGQALLKYKGQENVFGSFTAIPKLGLNPGSTYNTPVGVYAYPVDYIIQTMQGGDFGVPFANDQPYLHVFQVPDLSSCLIFSRGDRNVLESYLSGAGPYSQKRFEKIKRKVERIKRYVDDTLDEIPSKNPYSMNGKTEYPEFLDWYRVWIHTLFQYSGLKDDPDDHIVHLIKAYGYLTPEHVWYLSAGKYGQKGFPIDNVSDAIIRFLVSQEKWKTVLFPYEDKIKRLREVRAMGSDSYRELKDIVMLERAECDEAFAWNMTRHISNFNSRKWTNLLLRVGINGAVDYGTGTIHPNEPTQAVFLRPGMTRIIEVIDNRPGKIKRKQLEHTFSEWAENRDKGVKEAFQKLSSYFYLLDSTGNTQGSVNVHLSYIDKLVSWLNQHASEDNPDWNREVKQRTITALERTWDNYSNDPQMVKYFTDKVNRILAKLRR
jgi:hypothetical protein